METVHSQGTGFRLLEVRREAKRELEGLSLSVHPSQCLWPQVLCLGEQSIALQPKATVDSHWIFHSIISHNT